MGFFGPFYLQKVCLLGPFLVLFCTPGTESERSYSGRESQRRLLRQSLTGSGHPMKIAAIGNKHKVSRYLSKECEYFYFIFYPIFYFVLIIWDLFTEKKVKIPDFGIFLHFVQQHNTYTVCIPT